MGRLLDALRRLEERQAAVGAHSAKSEGAAAPAATDARTGTASNACAEPRQADTEQVLEELIDIGRAAQQAAQTAECRPAEQAAEIVAETHGYSGAAAWPGECVDPLERTAFPQAQTEPPQTDWAACDRTSWAPEPYEPPPWQQCETTAIHDEAAPPSAAAQPVSADATVEQHSMAQESSALDWAPVTSDADLDGAAAPTGSPDGNAALPSDAADGNDSLRPAASIGDGRSPDEAAWPSRTTFFDQTALFEATPLSDDVSTPDHLSTSDDVPSFGATPITGEAALSARDDRDSPFDRLTAAVLERWNNTLPAVLLIASVGDGPPPQWPAALARRLQAAVGSSVPVRQAADLTPSDVLDLRRRYRIALISASSMDANIAPLAAESDGAYLCVRIGSDRLGDIEQTAATILARGGLLAGLIAE